MKISWTLILKTSMLIFMTDLNGATQNSAETQSLDKLSHSISEPIKSRKFELTPTRFFLLLALGIFIFILFVFGFGAILSHLLWVRQT